MQLVSSHTHPPLPWAQDGFVLSEGMPILREMPQCQAPMAVPLVSASKPQPELSLQVTACFR